MVLISCRRLMAVALLSLSVATSAVADANSDANALLVEALLAWNSVQAMAKDDPGRRVLLVQINRNLDQIINDLSGSDVAVRLVTGETLGPLTLQGARDALGQIPAQDCFAEPDPACLLAEALATVQGVDGNRVDDKIRNSALAGIFVAQAQAGFVDEAVAGLRSLDDYVWEPYMLLDLAGAMAWVRREDEVPMLMAGRLDPAYTQYLPARIAIGQAASGGMAEARATVRTITTPEGMLATLARIGAVDEAAALAGEQFGGAPPSGVAAALAGAQARAADIEAEISTLRAVSNEDELAAPLTEVALAQARAGQMAAAIVSSSGLPIRLYIMGLNRMDLIVALSRISPDPALVTEAESVLQTLPQNDEDRAVALDIMAIIAPDAGWQAKAAAALHANPTGPQRNLTLSKIARSRAAAGQFAEAVEAARHIVDADPPLLGEYLRAQTFATMAQAMATQYNQVQLRRIRLNGRARAKSKAAAATMDGPAGVSCHRDSDRPRPLARMPARMAKAAIASGVRDRARAAAAGMISMAAISRAPTTFRATATTKAKAMVRIRRSRLGSMPEA